MIKRDFYKILCPLVLQFIGACLEPVMVVVTELLVGGSLRKYLVNLRPRSLEPRVAVGFALDIARAMECLHAHGIIHRDLKPGNSRPFCDLIILCFLYYSLLTFDRFLQTLDNTFFSTCLPCMSLFLLEKYLTSSIYFLFLTVYLFLYCNINLLMVFVWV